MDQILDNFVGGHGKYQITITIATSLINEFANGIFLMHIFTAYAPKHRCRVSQCEAINAIKVSSDIYNPEWLPFAIPKEIRSNNFLDGKNTYDGCKKFQRISVSEGKSPLSSDSDLCNAGYFINETKPCSDYIFDNTYFDETLTTKLDLVCENENKRNFLGTILILAMLFGSFIGGRIGDQYGRKKVFLAAILIAVPSIIIQVFLNSFEVYAFLHFVTLFLVPAVWVNGNSYSTEIWSSKWRYVYPAFAGIPLGRSVLALIVYLNRTWTGIHIWCGIASACALIPCYIIPESPRWLAQNNQVEESMKVLLKMAKINGKILSLDDEIKIRNLVSNIDEESHKTEDKLTPLDMFKHGQLKKSLILCLAWIVTSISYYVLGLNSSDLSGDIIMNFFLASIANSGSILYVVSTANSIGRRKSLSLAFMILGTSCLVLAFVPKNYDKIILTFYLIGTLVAGASFVLVYLITSELYPTNLRSQAVGSASTISRVFSLIVPYMGPLAKIWTPFPMVIIGIPILISALLVMKLPETCKKNLPQTVQDVKNVDEVKISRISQEFKNCEKDQSDSRHL